MRGVLCLATIFFSCCFLSNLHGVLCFRSFFCPDRVGWNLINQKQKKERKKKLKQRKTPAKLPHTHTHATHQTANLNHLVKITTEIIRAKTWWISLTASPKQHWLARCWSHKHTQKETRKHMHMSKYTQTRLYSQKHTHTVKPFPREQTRYNSLWTSKSLFISFNTTLQLSHFFVPSSLICVSLCCSVTLNSFFFLLLLPAQSPKCNPLLTYEVSRAVIISL